MCIAIHLHAMADHRPARRTGRDIRLSTATMRALESRRLRLTSTDRSFLFLVVALLCVGLHGAGARTLNRDGSETVTGISGVVAEKTESENRVIGRQDPVDQDTTIAEAPEKIDKVENVGRSEPEVAEEPRKNALVPGQEVVEEKEGEIGEKKSLIEAEDDDESGGVREEPEASVAKKRRRNDVALSGKSDVQDGEGIQRVDEVTQEVKDEGIRRFDGQVENEAVETDRKRLIDVRQPQIDDVKVDDVKEVVEVAPEVEIPAESLKIAQEEGSIDQSPKSSEKSSVDEIPAQDAELSKIEVQNVLRSSGAAEVSGQGENEKEISDEKPNPSDSEPDANANREFRYLGESKGKSKFKSSTVYLNAEDKKVPDNEQESIVDGQIKKLISIRDDVLDAAADGGQTPDKFDTTILSSKKDDEATVEVRRERRSDLKEAVQLKSEKPAENRLEKWKHQATVLQEQIRNRTFLLHLREQAIEVLPEIPKFTEIQLLDTLKKIVSPERSGGESYAGKLNESSLNENQLEIIKCAEQLVAVKQRQSFMTNMVDCIRGLSVLNCMRIFVWPVVVDNLPESIGQNLANLPIEINLIDLFQGNRAKSARAQEIHGLRILTPESVVFSILRQALESNPGDEKLPTYIDPKNETLRKLLTYGQVEILRMAEKFLPEVARKEYSDRMFSCVRRFEYFSCVKYFAWPMVKQYFPSLPAFPDYQSWYPTVSLYPEYPILPFPGFSEDVGELPEVVEADATRTKKPKPEEVIAQILRNVLKEQPRQTSPSFLDQSLSSYAAVIPRDQLMTIHMAEQLIPISYRPEFVQKSVRCMQEHNYLTCIKYSTWPTVRQFFPGLPDLGGYFPDLSDYIPDVQAPDLSGIFSYFPDLPSVPDFSSFVPGGGNPEQPVPAEVPVVPVVPDGFLKKTSPSLDNLEAQIKEILLKMRNSGEKSTELPSLIVNGNVVILTTITERQLDILRLAESLLPPAARASLIAQSLTCIQRTNDFVNCTRYVIWPSVARYVSNLPEFPKLEMKSEPASASTPAQPESSTSPEEDDDCVGPEESTDVKITSRTPLQESRNKAPNVPVISVTGTRFVPIFTEHPESVIFNILRSVQLASPNVNGETTVSSSRTQQFVDLLNQQQENIIRITESLLPDSIRPVFVNRMIDCVRDNNFVTCSRDVLWPMMIEYFPRLPSFPNFGVLPTAPNNSSTAPASQNLTESSSSSSLNAPPLSETNVKTGQHGDATVTITDTRFFPILNELPETVILNILKAVQMSTPNLQAALVPNRAPDFANSLSEQQVNIMNVIENLLPVSMRQAFVDRMVTCVRQNNFLECTRDIAWPTIAQFFPRLPNFPNFGTFQNLPRTRLEVLLDEAPAKADPGTPSDEKPSSMMEKKIKDVLVKTLEKSPSSRVQHSYLDPKDPAVADHLTGQQISIIRLVEKGIPEAVRATYITRMLNCVQRENFISCTQRISWPSLKQSFPGLPDFGNFNDYFPYPGLPQVPDLGQFPSFPGIGSAPFQELPGIPQFPGEYPQLPAGFPQFPGGVPQIPSIPQFGALRTLRTPQGETVPHRPGVSEKEQQEREATGGIRASITPSVEDHAVPGYAGQPPGILLDISRERIQLPEDERPKTTESEPESKTRRRRSTVELFNSYYDVDETPERTAPAHTSFPRNITESEFLQLLVNITKQRTQQGKTPTHDPQRYFVDTLNSTVRKSLTADQHAILKIVEDLNDQTASKGFMSRVVQCIRSLSFIRCMGIFVWPIISSNLPSLPSVPTFGLFGRSAEMEVEEFFGMSRSEFEKELLLRKESIERYLVDWYRKLLEEKFQTSVGFLKIRGYGNGELGISFAGFREGRGTKIKDNKNLPSILTIISDIMEEVLDQRPDHEKIKKDKDKRERSIEHSSEADIQFLKDTEEFVDIRRSMNDDEIIAMFLEKIRNSSDIVDGDDKNYPNLESAFNAFEVLFGTRLNDKLANRLQAYEEARRRTFRVKNRDEPKILPLERKTEAKVLPLKSQVSYDFERESSRDQEQRQRQKRAKNFFKSFLDKYSDKYLKDTRVERFEDDFEENKINAKTHERDTRSELIIRLPRLNEDIVPRKLTSSIAHLGRGYKNKMMELMPGVGLIISFLIQMALSHARAAASMASMLSNMAMGSAMFGMIRQTLMGPSTPPKIKYVYDNDKMEPGVIWPQNHGPYRRG